MNRGLLLTARLELSTASEADAAAWLDYELRNRRHFAPLSPRRDEAWFSLAAAQARAQQAQQDLLAGRACTWLLRRRDDAARAVIGHVTLSEIVRGVFQAAYLGFGVDHAERGQGLAREALELVIEHAFGKLGLHRLMANHLPENFASSRLLHKLGFVQEGFAPNYLLLNGYWRDHVLTALSNPDWQAAAPAADSASATPLATDKDTPL
ncbi:GNAT family N-acetyltransferase [Uliginosibacterium sediminicola]|uniref:GNAT family N-acetyltransferase n=1 Tax=Uliginosibacterium sediminicola TaxID=2024550 RepID=A0ABU9YXA9_9RHOO